MPDKEDPAAKLARWISNLERHEQRLIAEIEKIKSTLTDRESSLRATKNWLKKLEEIHSMVENTNRESVELLEDDCDDDDEIKQQHGTQFDRVQAFLVRNNNEPHTVAEIADGTGIPRTSLSAVLYRTHSDRFVSTYLPTKKGKSWSLRHPPERDADSEVSFDPPPELLSDSSDGFDEPTPQGGGDEIPF
jgi:DNA-binding transcriptional regulator GbsR (MarR family)